jgi:ribonuclease P protein component
LFATPSGRGQSGSLRVSFVADVTEESSIAVAYAISRKVGNAVVRNRIRRRLRALVDHLDPQPKPGKYLIRCGNETGNLSYEELQHQLNEALARAGAL